MKYTLHIDHLSDKATALINYLQTLDFIDLEEENASFEIPEWQKDSVRDRIKSTSRDSYLSENEFESRVDSEQ